MGELPYEKRFHFQDGSTAKDLAELKQKLEAMPYSEFYRHVNEKKNDFANWIEYVLLDKRLADRLRAVTSIVEMVELLNEELSPDEVVRAEVELKERGEPDFQERIEEELFSTLDDQAVHDEVPEFRTELAPDVHEVEEPKLPSREEIEFAGRIPGAPVVSRAQSHRPITHRVPRREELEAAFLVKQFVYGFILGVITGVIIGRIVSIYLMH